MRVGVVMPTITGRESLLAKTQKAYAENTPDDIELVVVVPKDAVGIGDAWNAGATALKEHECDYLHLSADDVEPFPGWAESAIEAAEDGIYPSPRLTLSDGRLESCGTLGGGFYLPEVADGSPAGSSGLPFMPFRLWSYVEPVPSIHYYADDFVAYMVRNHGLKVQVKRGYHFTHLEGETGRAAMAMRAMKHREVMLAEVAHRCFAMEVA